MQVIGQAVESTRQGLFGGVLDAFVAAPVGDSSGCAVARLVDVVNRSGVHMGNTTDLSVMRELREVVHAAQDAVTLVWCPALSSSCLLESVV